MACTHCLEWVVDTAALDAHLLAIGLVPNSGKWITVRARKTHKFGYYR